MNLYIHVHMPKIINVCKYKHIDIYKCMLAWHFREELEAKNLI